MLLPTFLEISAEWRHCFPQQRTYLRALRQGLGGLVCLGRRTLARIIWTNGGEQRSWSGEYFLHSRCRWRPQQLFEPIWRKALPFCRGRLVGVAIDETRLRKTGRSIQQAFHQRDPLSPPFHVNLMLGLRFVQASLLVPLHRKAPTSACALPVRFECAPVPKRPGRRAGDEQREQYKQLQAQCRVSRRMAEMIEPLRAALDDAGGRSKTLVLALDGGFCNRTVFLAPRERVELLARARKDAVLCFGASGESRRFYAREKFRPQQVRRDETIEWRTAKLFYGGKRRKIRYKQVNEVYWQGGARRTPLRLLVVAPTPYRKSRSRKKYYRQPAYLLTTDLTSKPSALVQIYLDRWQIEVNHREEKDTWDRHSCGTSGRFPSSRCWRWRRIVRCCWRACWPTGAAYTALPKWRKRAKRPSCLDLVALLRKEMAEQPDLLAPIGLQPAFSGFVAAADG